MKQFKKIMFVVLALAPILGVLAYCLCNVGGDVEQTFVSQGSVTITDTANGVTFACTADSWADRVIMPMVGNEPVEGFFGAVGRLLIFLEDNVGIPISFPVVLSAVYMAYLFMVEFLFLIMDFILFVPRKCKEIFA